MPKFIIHYGISLAGAGANSNPPRICEAASITEAGLIAYEMANEEAESYGARAFGINEEEFEENRSDYLNYYVENWTAQKEKEYAKNCGKSKLGLI